MHNTLSRISNVFSWFTTVVTIIACAIALVHLVSTPVPDVKEGGLKLHNVQVVKGRPNFYSSKKEELAHIKFDLDIDLSTLFNWNTKQVFLYITATYPSSATSPSSPPSQAVIWDAILPHPDYPSHHNQYIYPNLPSSKSKRRSKASKEKQIPGLLRLEGQRPKYQITDPSGRIANRGNVTLELNYNIQPWVGALTWASAGTAPRSRSPALLGLSKYIGTWSTISGAGACTDEFDLPPLRDRNEAVKEVGKDGLGTARGSEANRGNPA